MANKSSILGMEEDFMEGVAARFRVLAHPVRLRILALLEENKLSVSEIQLSLDIPQAAVSQHLLAMKNQGILGFDRDGSKHLYYVKDENSCGILRCVEKAHSCNR